MQMLRALMSTLAGLCLLACSRDVPTGARGPTSGGGAKFGSGAAGMAMPVVDNPGRTVGTAVEGALNVHIEDVRKLSLEVITLACAGECADVEAVAQGGNPPYAFTWDDGTKGAKRHLCPGASAQFGVVATDTAIVGAEFNYEAHSVHAALTANVGGCSDAGLPPATGPCGGDGTGNLIVNGGFEQPVEVCAFVLDRQPRRRGQLRVRSGLDGARRDRWVASVHCKEQRWPGSVPFSLAELLRRVHRQVRLHYDRIREWRSGRRH